MAVDKQRQIHAGHYEDGNRAKVGGHEGAAAWQTLGTPVVVCHDGKIVVAAKTDFDPELDPVAVKEFGSGAVKLHND